MSTIADLLAVAPEIAGGPDHTPCGPILRKPGVTGQTDYGGTEERLAWRILVEHYPDAHDRIMGVAQSVSILGKSVIRMIPMEHPWFPQLYAVRVNWTLEGESGDPAGAYGGFKYARMEVTFRSMNFNIPSMPFCELTANPSQRSRPIGPNGVSIGGSAGWGALDFPIGGSDFEITMRFCPYNDIGLLLPYARYSNLNPFLENPAECVIYHGGRIVPQPQISTAGQSITLGFSATSPDITWNQMAAASGGATSAVTINSIKPHPPIDFSDLII